MTTTELPAPDTHRAGRRAVTYVLVASLLFVVGNVAWRFGSGTATSVVAFRALLGAIVGWVIARRQRAGPWWAALRSRSGIVAVVSAGASLVVAGTMFRTLDGPLAGLAVACTPAVALLVRDRVGPVATLAALGSSAAAVLGLAAATTGDRPAVTLAGATLAVLFVVLEVVSMRSAQLAVEGGIHAAAIVTASMLLAAVAMAPVAVLTSSGEGLAALASAAGAALVVAVVGTGGRVLRTTALPAAGVAATAASAQITALGTGLAGVLLLDDHVTALGVLCTFAAAGLGATAVVVATRWRLARHAELALPLEVAPALAD